MGILTGSLDGRRFRVTTPLPDDFRHTWPDALREHAFEESDAPDGDPRLGWVQIFDHAQTRFELNDLLFDRYLAITLRCDTKKIPSAYLRIALAKREAAVKAEKGKERLSKGEKELLKEELEAGLYARVLPNVATTDVLWDVISGEVTVFSTSEATLEQVRLLVKDSLGVRLHLERLVDWLADKLSWAEILQRVGTLPGGLKKSCDAEPVDGHRDADPLEGHEALLGSDFLTWLWLRGESSDGVFRVLDAREARAEALRKREGAVTEDEVTSTLRQAELRVWIDRRLELQEVGGDLPTTTILLGEAPATAPEARASLHQGKVPVAARLGLKLNDLECGLTLRVTPEGVRFGGVKINAVAEGGREDKLLERAVLLDLFQLTLKQLFQQFFLARTTPDWEERKAAWLAEETPA